MAYVPPHLRNKQSALSQADSGPSSLALESLQKRKTTSWNSFYSLDDLCTLLQCTKADFSTITINRTPGAEETTESERREEEDGDSLRAIVLYADQHPDWNGYHKILCKSNLHVLHKLVVEEKVRADGVSAGTTQIRGLDDDYPVFEEVPFFHRKFEFAGWWKIHDITFLAPRSPELVAHFEKKFTKQTGRGQSLKQKPRSVEAWHESLNREWAVVTLVQNKARNDTPKFPSMEDSRYGEELHKESPVVKDDSTNSTTQTVDG